MSRTCVTALRRCLSGSGWAMSPFHLAISRSGYVASHGEDEKGSSVHPQVSFDDLDGDRGSGVGSEAAALDNDADRYLRVAGGRVAGEHRVVQARAADGVLRCA